MPRIRILSSSEFGEARSGFLDGNDFPRDQFGKHFVEVDHPGAAFVADDRGELIFPALGDVFLDVGGIEHDFDAGDALLLRIERRHQFLKTDRDQVRCERKPDVFVLVLGKQLEDAGDGARGARCVDRRKDQVPGLGGLDPGLKSEAVTHLPDQDHVRVLAQHRADAMLKGVAIQPDLTLIDQRLSIHIAKFNRIFDRHQMHIFGFVDLLQHRGDRRRFSRAGDPRQDDQPLLPIRDF